MSTLLNGIFTSVFHRGQGSIKDQAVHDTLRPMAIAFTIILFVHAVVDLIYGDMGEVWSDGCTAAIFCIITLFFYKRMPPPAHAHRWASVIGALLLQNIAYSYYYDFGNTALELYLVLFATGLGVVMLSRRHYAVLFSATFVLWITVNVLHADETDIVQKLIFLIVISGFSFVTFLSRRRTYARLENELMERRSTESALNRTETRYRDLVDNQGEGMIILDGEGGIVFNNPAATELFGAPETALTGRRLASLLPDGEWRYFSEKTTACETGNRIRFEMPLTRATGDSRHLLVTATPMADDSGLNTQLLCLFRDITDRKLSEEKQQKLNEQLQRSQQLESLGILAGGIAHEFNNILMGVMGNADVVLRDADLDGEPKLCVEEIIDASKRAAVLCRAMLGYSGKGRFVVTRLNLSEVIREMGHLLDIPTTSKAAIKYQLSEVIPAIEGDASQIGQVVMNLVTNAAEAIDKPDGEIIVTTNVTRLDRSYTPHAYLPMPMKPGSYVSLEVTDNGCGMDEKTKKHLFDPFFTTKFTGRGLGLAAVLGIIRGHNGTVEVYTEPRKGSSFRVLFPSKPGPVTTRADAPAEKSDFVGRGTVLLVDDEPMVLRIGVRMLKQMGFEVITARDGVEAVAAFEERRHTISLVILDQTMPRMNGEAVFRKIHDIDAVIPVMLSSGYNETEIAADLIPHGLAGFLPKPYDIDVLKRRVKAVLEGRQAFDSMAPDNRLDAPLT